MLDVNHAISHREARTEIDTSPGWGNHIALSYAMRRFELMHTASAVKS